MDLISKIVLLGAAGAGGPAGWIAGIRLQESDGAFVAVDSSDNIYISSNERNNKFSIFKLSPKGELQWQKLLSSSSSSELRGKGLAVAGGSLYVTGYGFGSQHNTTDGVLASFSTSDGSINWVRKHDAGNYDNFSDCAVDSSGNIYAVGNAAAGYDTTISKWNSSGTLLWSRRLGDNDTDFISYTDNISIAPSGNLIINGSKGQQYKWVASLNPDPTTWGSSQTARTMSGGIYSTSGGSCVNSSNSFVLIGAGDGGGYPNQRWNVALWNSSGTLVWKKVYTGPATSNGINPLGCAFDLDGNLYVVGQAESNRGGAILKINPANGSIIWAKDIGYNYSGTNFNNEFYGVAFDSKNNVIVSGRYYDNTTVASVAMKLPSTGPLNGTYSQWVIRDSTIVDSGNQPGTSSVNVNVYTQTPTTAFTNQALANAAATFTLTEL